MQFLKLENYSITLSTYLSVDIMIRPNETKHTRACRMRRLRLALGIRRQTNHPNFAEHNSIMRAALKKRFASWEIAVFGRRLTYQEMKQCGIPVAWDQLCEILRTLDWTGINERPVVMQKISQGTFKVSGVNELFSVDGYHKLSPYGI